MLLIGHRDKLKALIPTAESGFQMLHGTELQTNESFYLPLLASIEQIINFINVRNPEREMEMGMLRVSIPEFDHRAIREAVVNAFAHRLCKALHNRCYAKLIVMQSYCRIHWFYRKSGSFYFA